MSIFGPNQGHLRRGLLSLFYRAILGEPQDGNVPTQDTCLRVFRSLKSNDFDLEYEERPGQPKMAEMTMIF
ncbi:hypothetical protein CEXT_356981 [Caerostris extrusa]|uniref:Uncharacterized protein n=1 Tax=Caerostris extrusa TaxID=172846 RepID=A0AAV4RCS7_CAEEX|nr:hypothetical protein CEXT_356981 [Caerostris extrusa]